MTTPRHRWRARALFAALLAPLFAITAVPVQPVAGDPLAEKKAEAERVAKELEVQGQRVSVLAERLNQARLRSEAAAGEVAAAEAELSEAERLVGLARTRLRHRAVASYMAGPQLPVVQLLVSGSAGDVAVGRAYVAAVVGHEQAAINSLDAAQERRRGRRAELEEARVASRLVLDQVADQRRSAEEAASARRATLARVEGELGALVQAQAARRAEEAAQKVRAELAARLARDEAARTAAAERASEAARKDREQAARRAAEEEAGRARPVPARPPAIAPAPAPTPAPRPPAAGAEAAVAEARRQLGKPYQYGADGPDSFDCSGLTMWAWRAGGRGLPHSSAAQYGATTRVAVADVQPGDLLFYGSPIHHVGIYAGNGTMIEASETGTPVRTASIYRRDLVGVGRVG